MSVSCWLLAARMACSWSFLRLAICDAHSCVCLRGEIKPSCMHTCPHELMVSYLTDLPKNYCIINPISSHSYLPIQDTLACGVDTKHHILDNGTNRAGVVVRVMSFRIHSLAPSGWHPHSQTCRPPPPRDGPFKSWLRPFDIGTLRAFIHLALWNTIVNDLPKLKHCLIKLTMHRSNHIHACCHIPLPQATKRQAIQSCWLAISDDFFDQCCMLRRWSKPLKIREWMSPITQSKLSTHKSARRWLPTAMFLVLATVRETKASRWENTDACCERKLFPDSLRGMSDSSRNWNVVNATAHTEPMTALCIASTCMHTLYGILVKNKTYTCYHIHIYVCIR